MQYDQIIAAYHEIRAGDPVGTDDIDPAAHEDVLNLMRATMWADLPDNGGQGRTQWSRSGRNIVFSPAVREGRADLSTMLWQAKSQMERAGLSPESLPESTFRRYLAESAEREARQRRDYAQIIITGIFGFDNGRELVPSNRVTLRDGAGENLKTIVVACRKRHDANATNHLGERGAYVAEPDRQNIARAVRHMQHIMPDAPIHYGHTWDVPTLSDDELGGPNDPLTF